MRPPALRLAAASARSIRRFRTIVPSSTSSPSTTTRTNRPLTSAVLLNHQLVPSSSPRRSYHSTTHPPPPGPFTPVESAILSAAYQHVPTHGFTPEALALGARSAGYLDISATVVPDGVFGLIRWHLVTQRLALAGKKTALFGAEENKLVPGEVARRVEALVWERLMGNKEINSRWQEALAIMAQPTYVPASVKELALLVDEIWYLAGDVAVDPSWYTKRASLSAIYAASELFMTNDRSPDFQETREFLRRRLGEASEIGDATRSVREWVSFTASAGINVLRSKGMPI
ncbi:COQ9-domain-containing protein [Echria macrotheca]|uniref:Ubiquinone biosynthesis protein n=1 Tax=Echria macrotheca TaxID=438768 RepID=A0AAJ0BAL8_9PEZI|nr:COQ9-domain-containing protein [Echria macrotheca]